MKGRLWAEAKALAGLAEAYARLSERAIEEVGLRGRTPQDEAALAAILERLGLNNEPEEEAGYAAGH